MKTAKLNENQIAERIAAHHGITLAHLVGTNGEGQIGWVVMETMRSFTHLNELAQVYPAPKEARRRERRYATDYVTDEGFCATIVQALHPTMVPGTIMAQYHNSVENEIRFDFPGLAAMAWMRRSDLIDIQTTPDRWEYERDVLRAVDALEKWSQDYHDNTDPDKSPNRQQRVHRLLSLLAKAEKAALALDEYLTKERQS